MYIGLPGFLGVEVATSASPDPRQQAADEAQGAGGRAAAGSGASCQSTNAPVGVPAKIAPIAAGALVLGVLCDTAATSAGMVPGDVITSVAGQPITTPDSLTGITAKYHPNDIVSVIWVSLNGIEHTTRMMLGAGRANQAERAWLHTAASMKHRCRMDGGWPPRPGVARIRSR